MKQSAKQSNVDGAVWYEREKNGIFQKDPDRDFLRVNLLF